MIIKYPNKLNRIFDKLKINNIKPILIGGYIRDNLLQNTSNDIDIEVYGVNSFKKLEEILQEFGNINRVGKSFGVCKLTYKGLDLDFSLPRQDSKVSDGHKGFEIKIDPSLDFVNATKRRDFTINAIGYDVFEKKILDPFGGLIDLRDRVLRAVDRVTFVEDPLRVLRLVQFTARFEMDVDEELFALCQQMVKEREFKELAYERIYEEIKKLLLKSSKPSIGIKLLHTLGLYKEWRALDEVDLFSQRCRDIKLQAKSKELPSELLKCIALTSSIQKESLLIHFALLYNTKTLPLLHQIITDTKLFNTITTFINYSDYLSTPFKNITNYQLYFLATKVKLVLFFVFLDAKTLRKYTQMIEILCKRAKDLNILESAIAPILQGKDLFNYGLTPSKEFKTILDNAYEAQMHEKFHNKAEALLWLENYLKIQ